MKLEDLTTEDLHYIRRRAQWYARATPWVVEDLAAQVCLELCRRPDLILNHPLTQAVNMLTPQRLIDILKRPVQQIPSGISADEFDNRTPAFDFLAEEQEWTELQDWLTDLTDARAARSAITFTRFRTGRGRVDEHALVAEAMGVSRSQVTRDLAKVRKKLSERNP